MLNDIFLSSATLGVIVSLASFELASLLKKKFKAPILNPLMLAIVATIIFLLLFKVDYASYNASAKYLNYLLTPATVSLAIPLYMKIDLLKKNLVAILGGIVAGVITSMCTVLAIGFIFKLTHQQYVTLLPKSITTAIGMVVSEEYGGIAAITVAVIIITGIVGNMTAEFICKTFRIKSAISRGIAIGTASHAIGTGKAIEMGKTEGAMGGLAIAVAGVITVVAVTFFAPLI